MRTKSSAGAHRNFSEYGSPTSAKMPMAVLSTPRLASQYESVEVVSSSGSPLANPISRIASMRRSR